MPRGSRGFIAANTEPVEWVGMIDTAVTRSVTCAVSAVNNGWRTMRAR